MHLGEWMPAYTAVMEAIIDLQVCKAALQRQLLLITAGSRAIVRFLPALNVSAAEIAEGLAKFEFALVEVFTDGPYEDKGEHGTARLVNW